MSCSKYQIIATIFFIYYSIRLANDVAILENKSGIQLKHLFSCKITMATEIYGKLLIVGKKDKSELEFPLDKKSILIGRSVDGSW